MFTASCTYSSRNFTGQGQGDVTLTTNGQRGLAAALMNKRNLYLRYDPTRIITWSAGNANDRGISRTLCEVTESVAQCESEGEDATEDRSR